MNEFLQNLRSNSRRNNSRQQYKADGVGNHINDRRSGNDRRIRASRPSGVREETINSLKVAIDDIQTTLQDQLLITEKMAEANERQADALDQIADLFSVFMERVVTGSMPAPERHEQPVDISSDSEHIVVTEEDADAIRKTSRTYILSLIDKLRHNHKTYDEIALYLTENDFPTFSGRGKWHAQTIHRLCQEIKKAKEKKNKK